MPAFSVNAVINIVFPFVRKKNHVMVFMLQFHFPHSFEFATFPFINDEYQIFVNNLN